MNNFECFCESVFYESTGLGSLYELDNALKVYIRAIRLTEALTRHTQPNFQADVNEVYEKARFVFHLTLPIDKIQNQFKRIEKLIFSLIAKLKDIQEDDRLDNNANAGIVTAFENALNQFFANLQADFIAHNLELHHSFTVGTNNTILVRDTDFTYQFYERAYEVRLGNKSSKSRLCP